MDKPEWVAAPSWAAYLAQDADGDWYWFEQRPTPSHIGGYWGKTDLDSRVELAGHGYPPVGPMEPRP